jgi:enoyl-CoA hydratase
MVVGSSLVISIVLRLRYVVLERAMDYQETRLHVEGPIATLSLARPDVRNAMTATMGREVSHAVSELNAREDVRVVLVRGEGAAFCAGGDLKFIEERTDASPESNRSVMLQFYRAFLSVRELRAPSIAVLHGPAIGAGLCFALACDIRVAARGATMGLTFVKLGLHPGMGATYTLTRLLGPGAASRLLLTGRVIEADEALGIGLVDEVHAPDALDAGVKRLASEIASASPLAVAQTKATLHGERDSLARALEREADAQAVDYQSLDLKEGLRALREKRAPRFTGR